MIRLLLMLVFLCVTSNSFAMDYYNNNSPDWYTDQNILFDGTVYHVESVTSSSYDDVGSPTRLEDIIYRKLIPQYSPDNSTLYLDSIDLITWDDAQQLYTFTITSIALDVIKAPRDATYFVCALNTTSIFNEIRRSNADSGFTVPTPSPVASSIFDQSLDTQSNLFFYLSKQHQQIR